MRAFRSQRGFLLIAAAVIIVAAAVMALVIVTLVAGASRAGAQHMQAAQALFIAESGLDRGIYQWNLDNAYAGEGPIGFGGGSYTITTFDTDAAGDPLPGGQKRIRSSGSIGSDPGAARTVEALVSLDLFVEQFPDQADFNAEWGEVIDPIQTDGSSGYDGSNCPATTCPNTLSGSGSLHAETSTGVANQQFAGYRERDLPQRIATGAGLTVDVEVGYMKNPSNNNPRVNEIRVTLFDSTAGAGGEATTVWSNTDKRTATWVLGTAAGVVLPASRNYDSIRLEYVLHEQGNNEVSAFFDEIRIRAAGAGVAREAWREVFP